MTPERWQQVNELFMAVVGLEPDQRAAVLDESCSHDQLLRSEVESLLAADRHGWKLFERGAFELAAPLLVNEQPQLTPGQTFSHYEIVNLIGKGGMGEVYLAHDEKLHRKIALKLLPSEFTTNEERLHRFYQEARTASVLNHPNIITIHEIGDIDNHHFIATEFVDGQTLRLRLRKSRLSVQESLDIAIQICGALSAAHRAGIVHRDIKPENIMLRADGYVKVLDFGLAKLTEQLEPTIEKGTAETVDISSALVMGTVKYMSPEQARGLPVDARSDIFSLGVVLYEMLTGRTPFEGKTPSELITAILKNEPPPLTDAREEIQSLVRKTLSKKKEERYQTIQALLVDLKTLNEDKAIAGLAGIAAQGVGNLELSTIETGPLSIASSIQTLLSGIRRRKIGAAFVFTSFLVVVVGMTFGLSRFTRLRSRSSQMRIIYVPNTDKAEAVAISPDGKYIAQITSNAGQYGISLVEVATGNNTPVNTAPSGTLLTNPSFSKDGSRIYYVSDSALYEVPVRGGEPAKIIGDVDSPLSIAPDERQVAFVRNRDSYEETSLIIVNVDGTGKRVIATKKNPEFIDLPTWSPDGKLIACTSGRLASNRAERLITIEVATGQQTLVTESWQAFLSVAWLPDSTGLVAAATEVGDGSPQICQIWHISYPAGEVRRITNDLNNYGGLMDRYGGLALTADGKSLVTIQWAQRSSLWVVPKENPEGAKSITSNDRYVYRVVSFTRDGRILYPSDLNGNLDIWVMNIDGTNPRPLTANAGANIHSNASPDGRYIVYSSDRVNNGAFNIWRMNGDGSNPTQLTHGDGETGPTCSPDGLWVVYSKGGPEVDQAQKTLWKVSIDGGEPVQLTNTSSFGAAISPEGALIACWYKRDAASPWQLALIPLSGGPPTRLFDVPRTTIRSPRWTPDGEAISYISTTPEGVSNIWSQPISGGPPKEVTEFTAEQIDGFDWSRDGQLVCSRLHGNQNAVLISNFR